VFCYFRREVCGEKKTRGGTKAIRFRERQGGHFTRRVCFVVVKDVSRGSGALPEWVSNDGGYAIDANESGFWFLKNHCKGNRSTVHGHVRKLNKL